MYKFTNGMIVYDKDTKENLLKAGYKLIEQIKVDEAENEYKDDSRDNINEEYSRNNKKARKHRK